MIITALLKTVGFNTNQSQIHLKDGCANVKKRNPRDWQAFTIDYDEWRNLPRACVRCARLARPKDQK